MLFSVNGRRQHSDGIHIFLQGICLAFLAGIAGHFAYFPLSFRVNVISHPRTTHANYHFSPCILFNLPLLRSLQLFLFPLFNLSAETSSFTHGTGLNPIMVLLVIISPTFILTFLSGSFIANKGWHHFSTDDLR